jgi:hypothetical protein
VRLEAESSDARIQALAFRRPDDAHSVIVLNGNRALRTIRLSGLGGKISQAIVSSDGNYEATIAPEADGALTLPPLSITSLVIR